MAFNSGQDVENTLKSVRWPLRLTWAGMCAEVLVQSLWPLMTVGLLVLAALMMGFQDSVVIEVVWFAMVSAVFAGVASIIYASRRLRIPTMTQALARLDASLPGRPLQALIDRQTIGAEDAASAAVWRAHQARMAERASAAEPVPADLRIAARDPYALRYMAALAFAVALLFGSIMRVGSVTDMSPGGAALATGPVWEGWVESPRYTGKPTIYLNDIDPGELAVPEGSLITIRLYGEVGALSVVENVSGRSPASEENDASDPAQDFIAVQAGDLSIEGPGGRTWQVALVPDQPPEIAITGDPSAAAMGEMTLPFMARDDYAVEAGEARFTLDLVSVDRRYGLTVEPETRPDLVVPLPMPISGSRADFEENLIEDFSEHPWANLPVEVRLTALDGAEQEFETQARSMVLPGRRFFDPLAAAVIEARRDLLWSRENNKRIAQVLRAVSYSPDSIFRNETDSLRLRKVIKSLELHTSYGMSDEKQQELADEMWDLALILEEGDLADAAERMRRAQERLNEAIRNGASDEEIAELMRELRRATEDYLQQLSRQAQRQQQGEQGQQGDPQNSMQMTQDDLQRMMDRIQELMEQGRMAEAQQALQELQQMMENMRVTQGQQGQGGQSPGEQAMEGLAETLREQQGLSDQAFRDLQEQFNPNAQAGESQGNEGRDGGQGRGAEHQGEGQQGQGDGQQQGQAQNGQQQGQQGSPGAGEGSIADRQRALRNELNRQQQNLPGAGTPEGDAARDALDRAGRAMDGAEEALRENDLAEAIDNQGQAMEALREGMRALGEMMAEQQQNTQPGQGMQDSDRRADSRDPLGRESGNSGVQGDDSPLALNEDAYGRARELLDEIRRRSGEVERPEEERDYLNRLLDRF
ncbi:MAG: TIGR02302 family protein [Roseobacter sp.]|jgi:uncharacterized protein (TIGR02302 family)